MSTDITDTEGRTVVACTYRKHLGDEPKVRVVVFAEGDPVHTPVLDLTPENAELLAHSLVSVARDPYVPDSYLRLANPDQGG